MNIFFTELGRWFLTNIEWIITIGVKLFTSIFCSKKPSKDPKEAMRFQLFDKRLELYSEIKSFVTMSYTDTTNEKLNEYLRLIKDVPLLFGEDVDDCCDKIYSALSRISRVNSLSEGKNTPETSDRLLDEYEKQVEELKNLNAELSELVSQYIDFSEYKTSKKRKPLYSGL